MAPAHGIVITPSFAIWPGTEIQTRSTARLLPRTTVQTRNSAILVLIVALVALVAVAIFCTVAWCLICRNKRRRRARERKMMEEQSQPMMRFGNRPNAQDNLLNNPYRSHEMSPENELRDPVHYQRAELSGDLAFQRPYLNSQPVELPPNVHAGRV